MRERIEGLDSGAESNEIIAGDLTSIGQRLERFAPRIKDKVFLVSGGAGFLGSYFVETALNMGGQVFCIDNLITASPKNIHGFKDHPNFTFTEGDITTAHLPASVDYIVHMASVASPPLIQTFPRETLEGGVLGTLRLLDYARGQRGLHGFLFTSTSEIYGDPPSEMIPTPETYLGAVNSFGPRSAYEEAKRAAEACCYIYREDIPLRIARIFNTYGPRIDVKHAATSGRALIKFVNQALENQPITVYGDGSQTRSFCYVVDQIVGLYQLLLTEGVDGQVVNIGNYRETSILQLARLIVELSGSKSPIVTDSTPAYDLENDPQRRSPDLSKAKELLGYSPEVALENGLQRTINWNRTSL